MLSHQNMVQRFQVRCVQLAHLESISQYPAITKEVTSLTYPNEALKMNRGPILRDPFLEKVRTL